MADGAGRELRIALSMRGGVSLAVWIGGAAREIDALTRHEADAWDSDPENWYAALLKLGGYERATIDVITGASAGGLNGVVLAASRVYGFPFHRMLPLWVEVADIELMSRDPLEKETDEETGRPTRRPASLMQGDEYFLKRLKAQLRALVAEGSDQDVVDQPFQLILSATLVNPSVQVTDEDPFSPMPEIRRDASFRFRYLGHDGGDFQERGQAAGAEPSSTVSLLSLAGRATSSFPVAFEPASVSNVAANVFSDPPSGSAAQRVIDGGVLDNIPVAKAIEAIADAPPSLQAERWLVFLHPSPGARPTETPPTERRASPQALATLAVTIGAAFSQESLLDDLEQLERYNAEAARLRLRRRAALAEVPLDGATAAGLTDLAGQRFGTSRAVRAQTEAVRTVRLLSGDLVVSGTQIHPNANLSARVRARGTALVAGLEDCYSAQFGSAESLCRSVGGLGLATELVAEWFGRLGTVALPEGLSDVVARRLGRLKRLVRVMRRRSDRSWVHQAVLNVDPSGAWLNGEVQRATTAARYGIVSGDVDSVAFRDSVDDGEGFDAALDVLDTVPTNPAVGPDLDLATIVWELLVTVLVDLAPFGADRSGMPTADVLDLVFGDPAGDSAILDAALEALVVVLTQAQTSGQTNDAEVRFMRISAANASPLSAQFLPTSAGQPENSLTADDKLCGNELANFSAFLSARWRANDWMWGRMDAAKSLVDLTIRPARIAVSELTVPEMIEIISRLVSDAGLTLDGERLAEVSAELTGVTAFPATADEATGLMVTRSVVTQAVQRRIFAEMEPVISALGESPWWPGLAVPGGLGAGSAATASPPVAPQTPLEERMAAYRVGRESLADLRSRRRTQIGMRLALVGYGALKPLKRKAPSRIARLVMAAIKPFLLFATFAALNVARAMFLVTMTLVGFWIGPWRYRGSEGHHPWEVLTYRQLPWRAGGEWWPEQMVPGGWLGWVFLGVIGVLSLYCLVRAGRLLIGRRTRTITADKRRRDIGWYLAAGLLAPALVVASVATGVATGPVLVALLAGGVGALTCRWMKPLATVAVGVLVTVTYVAVGAAFGVLVAISDRSWFSFTLWMSVLALYAAQLAIALFCTYAQVLPDEQDILRQARREATAPLSGR